MDTPLVAPASTQAASSHGPAPDGSGAKSSQASGTSVKGENVCRFLKSVSRTYGVCAALNAALAVTTGVAATGALAYGVVRIAEFAPTDAVGGPAGVAAILGQRVLLVWLLVTLSKLCFQYSRVCLGEARRHGNRKHIVQLGQLYVEASGKEATWETLATVLKDWDRLDGDANLDKIAPDIEAKMDGLLGGVASRAAAVLGPKA